MLTPEQLVAAIKLDEAVKARPSRDEVREPWATNPMRFESRDHTGAVVTPPKPPRVEKWQRWSNSQLDQRVTLSHVTLLSTICGCEYAYFGAVTAQTSVMLSGTMWTFLGYAKPDKVEVGQMWKFRFIRDCTWSVVNVIDGQAVFRSNHGADGDMDCRTLITAETWEYLGMAESAQDIEKAYTTDPSWKAPPSQTPESANQARRDARRALEATAKRLINNPPAWAYPKAWMMAVLRQVERGVPASRLEREFSPRFCFYEELRLYQERRLAGQTHDAAKAGLNLPELCDAYARGMDIRAKPLLTRPVGIGRVR